MHLRTYQKNITAYLSRALLALAFLVAPYSTFAFDINNLNTIALDTSKGFIAAFTLPLNFLTTSTTDYAHFTTGVGQTVAQNFTDAAHSSADLYRNVYTFTSTPVIDTTAALKQTLTDEVHTATRVAREGSMVFANIARDITDTTRDTLSHLSFSTRDFATLDTMGTTVGSTLASAATHSRTFTIKASDVIASVTSSARDNFNRLSFSQKNFGGLALNLPAQAGTKNQTASVFGAVNEFWTDFLYTVFGPTETVTTVTTPELPSTPQTPTPPQIAVTPPPTPSGTTVVNRITQPVITQPIVLRPSRESADSTTERVLSGITATDLEAQIASLRSELLNEIAKGKATAVQDNNALYLAMAPMNRINNLSSVTISNPTITGASISSGTLSGTFSGSVTGTSGSFDTLGIGTTTPSATFAVNGVTYLAEVSAPAVTTNRLYNVGGNLYWGATVIGGSSGDWTLTGSDVSYSTGNVGIGTTTPYATLSVVGTSVLGTITGGVWNGTAINDTYLNLGTGAGQLSAADMLITDTGSYFTGITGNTNAVLQHIGQEIGERWSSGVVSGGTIATSTGNTVDIAAGVGYIGSTRITWNASTSVAMTANGDNWISVDSTGAIRVDNTEPSIDNYIRLGYVYTTASNTVIGLAVSTPSYAGNYESRNNNFVMKGIGAVVQSGNIVGTTSTPLGIQATSGIINSNLKEFTVPDTSTFTKWYNSADNGWVTDTANNLVNTTKYNVTTNNQASALVTMTASYWKKDLILRTLDGNLHYVFGQAQYATEQAAKDGALPSIPTAITNGGSAYLATAVVQNGDTALTSRLYDIRPNLARVFGFGTSGTTGSIATHSALSGLGADDHTQYVLASGARSMAGSLNMGTNAITGLTSLTATGLLKTTLTTEQMRLGYDASNYTSFTVGSTGALTIGTTGTGTTTLTNGVNVGSGEGYWVNGARAVSGAFGSPTSFGFSNTVSSSGLAFGALNTSSSIGSTAYGQSNTSSNTFSVAFGYSNTASGSQGNALGTGNQATSTNAVAVGYTNNAGGTNSVAIGNTNSAYANGSIAIGRNVTNTTVNSLMIGPSDAAKLTILSTGNVGIGTTSPYAKLSVVGEIVGSYFTATSTTATSTFYGDVAIGSTGVTGARLTVNKTSTDTTAGSEYGISNTVSDTGITTSGTDEVAGLINTLTRTGATAGTNNTYGVYNSMFIDDVTSGTSNAYGVYTEIRPTDAVIPDNSYGAYSSLASTNAYGSKVLFNNGVGVNDGYGMHVSSALSGTGMSNVYGGYVASFTNATNVYGLYVANQGTSATHYGVYTDGSTKSYFGGNVGIGTTSPYAKLSVVGEIVGSYFTATSTTATSTFAGNLIVSGHSAFGATSGIDKEHYDTTVQDTVIDVRETFTTSEIQNYNGIYSDITANTGGSVAPGVYAGVRGASRHIGSSVATSIYGIYGSASNDSASGVSSVTSAVGVFGTADNASTGVVTNAYGGRFSVTNSGGGAMTNAYGILVANVSNTGSTNSYGINIANQSTAGATRFALYAAGTADKSYFGGNVGIGTTSPYAKLSVIGEVVASYFTATSTTATSTFANHISIGAGKSYRIDGNPVLSATASDLAVGINSGVCVSCVAVGYSNVLNNNSNIAMGIGNTSSGAIYATAVGNNNVSSGAGGLAFGNDNTASGDSSVAFGSINTASGDSSLALGLNNTASVAGSIAVGAGITNSTASSLQVGPSDVAKMTILSTGNIGIGTTTPFSKLTITSGNIGAFNGALCADNGGLAKCYGSLTAGVVYGDSSSFVASDIAENYPAADSSVEAGDIVMVATVLVSEEQTKRAHDKEKLETLYKDEIPASIKETLGTSIEKATTEGGYRIIGVVSTAPGVLLGDTTGLDLDTTFKPVALSGRVPLKVNNEGGEIKAGDLIALSSVPGVGAKATTTSRAFVGTALEDFSGDEGKILVFMNLSSARLDTKISGGTIGAGQSSFWDIDDSTGRLKYIAALDINDFDIINVKAIRGSANKWSIDAFGRMVVEELKTNKLCVGETCVDESMLKKILEKVGIFTTPSEPVVTPDPTIKPAPAADPTPQPVTVDPESTLAPETPAPEPVTEPVVVETPAVIPEPIVVEESAVVVDETPVLESAQP